MRTLVTEGVCRFTYKPLPPLKRSPSPFSPHARLGEARILFKQCLDVVLGVKGDEIVDPLADADELHGEL